MAIRLKDDRIEQFNNEAGMSVELGTMTEDEQEDLVKELEQVKQKNLDSEGKRAVLSKERIKEFIKRSPDNSDVLMMREYFDLKPVRSGASVSTPVRRITSARGQW